MKKIIPVLLAVLMIAIFLLSAQPADDSSLTSSHFAEFAVKVLFHHEYNTLTPEFIKQAVSALTFIVRKTAHFSEYALLGFLWYLLLKNTKNGIFLSLGMTFLYAVSDEFHQMFVAGRSAQFRDVMIDTAGGLFGIIVAFILICVVHCCLHKEIVHLGTWNPEPDSPNKKAPQ